VASTVEATIPELTERQAYAEGATSPGPEAQAKAPSIWLALGGLVVFIVLASIWG
jgi:hypothetical protein